MYWPDLWVGPTSPVSAMSSHFQPLPAISLKLSTNSGLQILHSMHFSHGLEVPLFSMTGKKIAILTSSNNTITINTAQIPAGIYMVRFNADTKQIAIPLYIR
jgi:hypothetical protein